jgi:hypothetical protein
MEPIEAPLRKLKVNWALEVLVTENKEDEFWVAFFDAPHMRINFGYIPYEERKHLRYGDSLTFTLDLEPRHAKP